VERFFVDSGGSFGVLFPDLLASAVGRPQQTLFGEDAYPTLAAKAAALTHSLVLNHVFRDANKRTGMLSGVVFMEVNGCSLVAPRDSLYQVAIGVENKSVPMNDLTDWYEAAVLPLTEPEMEDLEREERMRQWYGEHFADD
jgi:death-on-curing protein